MAKRKTARKALAGEQQAPATEKQNWFADKPASGPYKQCPECEVFIHAKKRACPKCGHKFAVKAKVAARRSRKPREAQIVASAKPENPVLALLGAAKGLGGIDAAIDTLRAIKAAK